MFEDIESSEQSGQLFFNYEETRQEALSDIEGYAKNKEGSNLISNQTESQLTNTDKDGALNDSPKNDLRPEEQMLIALVTKKPTSKNYTLIKKIQAQHPDFVISSREMELLRKRLGLPGAKDSPFHNYFHKKGALWKADYNPHNPLDRLFCSICLRLREQLKYDYSVNFNNRINLDAILGYRYSDLIHHLSQQFGRLTIDYRAEISKKIKQIEDVLFDEMYIEHSLTQEKYDSYQRRICKLTHKLPNRELNWNDYSKIFVVDHIFPVALFANATNHRNNDFKLCWHPDNLQLLTKDTNSQKSDYYYQMDSKSSLNILKLERARHGQF